MIYKKTYFHNNYFNCGVALILDGHMKGTRLVCDHSYGRMVTSEEVGEVELGCPQMPLKGSYHCLSHQSDRLEDECTSQKKVSIFIDTNKIVAPPPCPRVKFF